MTQAAANPLSLQEFIDVEAFSKEIDDDMGDLNEAMRTQTARAAYYGMKHAQAKRQKGRIDNIVKATEAKLRKELRKKLVEEAQEIANEEGGKPERITKDMVDAAIFTDARMIKLLNIQLEADEIENVCKVAYDAFRTRREMLVSMGHLTREQMRSQLAMREGLDTKNSIASYKQRRAARGAGPIPGDE